MRTISVRYISVGMTGTFKPSFFDRVQFIEGKVTKTYEFGNAGSNIVLIQPVDDHDLEGIEN